MSPIVMLANFLGYGAFLMILISALTFAYLWLTRQFGHLWPVVWRQCRSRRRAMRVCTLGIAPLGCYFLLAIANAQWDFIPGETLLSHTLIGLLLAFSWCTLFGMGAVVWLECAYRLVAIRFGPRPTFPAITKEQIL